MAENNKIHDSKLEKVAGGINTIFYGNTPVCPVCGQKDIKLIAGDEFTDTYKCDYCGSESVHTKKERPRYHANLQCRQCGVVGEWNLVKSENGIDTVECKVCRLQMTVPSEG